MSRRPSSKRGKSPFALALVAIVLTVSAGCGDKEKTAAPSAGTGATPTTADSSTAAATPSPATGGTGSSGSQPTTPTGADGGTSPGDKPAPAAGDEEGARTPVAITIDGDAFTDKTPKRVHVPAFIAIELDVGVRDGRAHQLKILRSGSNKVATKTVRPGYSTIELTGLRAGKTLTIGLGAGRVVVVADAEPGP